MKTKQHNIAVFDRLFTAQIGNVLIRDGFGFDVSALETPMDHTDRL